MARVHVIVTLTAGDAGPVQKVTDVAIPPSYDQQDIDALAARVTEDTAFALLRSRYGRRPTLDALIAHAARIRAVRNVLDRMPDTPALAEHRERLRAVLEASNNDITRDWGEDTEGG
jgi:PAS domain-containing protein